MQLAYALRGPPRIAFRPSLNCVVSKDVFGLSCEHERIFGLIENHLWTQEVWYASKELLPGENFSFGGSIPTVSIEEHSDDSSVLKGSNVEFVLVAKSLGNHFMYRACFTLPWWSSPRDHLTQMIAGVLAGDRELQYELEATVQGGSAEKRVIQAIEVTMCEWREV